MFSRALSRSLLAAAPRATRTTVRPVRPIAARAYHEKVISHYESPRNVSGCLLLTNYLPVSDNGAFLDAQVGSLPKNDIDVGTGLVGAPAYVPPPFCFLLLEY